MPSAPAILLSSAAQGLLLLLLKSSWMGDKSWGDSQAARQLSLLNPILRADLDFGDCSEYQWGEISQELALSLAEAVHIS